ncbi:N-formylglutamate amidohydrolase [Sphingobium aromaticiconvertens]|uniref:N-formylglutamate amidohydrolase n=1 Tax=Sphingobium aromaticiconvertens TaxID=365341 RepID=UPI0030183020
MAGRMTDMLLGPDDPAPFTLHNAAGTSPFLLIGDHAGDAIPSRLGDLGLSAGDRARHIALDIGVRGLGEALAERLNAAFLHQAYSRLVIDCNRDPASAEAMPALSDGSRVPGNEALDDDSRAARIAAIHAPYHAAIAGVVAARAAGGQGTILLALHSFTPVMAGHERPWHVGVLYWRGVTDFAVRMIRVLQDLGDWVVGDNEPYVMDDTDYTVPAHAFAQGLAYAEIEVRQDLIGTSDGQRLWADRLALAARAAAGG